MTNTRTIPARELHAGHRMINRHPGCPPQVIRRVLVCPDGAIRVFSDTSESRMTGSVLVRVLH